MSHDDCVVFVAMVESWKRKVGGGYIVGFFFFFGGWWLQVEKWWKSKVVRAWIVFFFFLDVVVCGYGWWGNIGGGGGDYCYCVVMDWFLWRLFIIILMSYLYYFKWVVKYIKPLLSVLSNELLK